MKYENIELCKSCGGRCCKKMGCHYAPEDFEDLSYEGLKQEIDKGYISIDWWEGNPITDDGNYCGYFLRVKNVGAGVVDPSWGGKCTRLTPTGCNLKYDNRPRGGRELVPSVMECEVLYDKKQCAIDWIPYNAILERLCNEYNDRRRLPIEELLQYLKEFE